MLSILTKFSKFLLALVSVSLFLLFHVHQPLPKPEVVPQQLPPECVTTLEPGFLDRCVQQAVARQRESGEVDAEANDEVDSRSALLKAADVLENKIAGKAFAHIDDIASDLDLGRKALEKQIYAAAECAQQNQSSVLRQLAQYVQRLSEVDALVPIAWLEHCLYDETPQTATVRFPGEEQEKHVERSKLFVFEQTTAVLLRRKVGCNFGVEQEGRACQRSVGSTVSSASQAQSHYQSDYLLILLQHNPALKVTERTTAETIVDIIRSVAPAEASASRLFRHKVRLA
eukprot:5504964-Amphidinium_carterae.10